MLTTGIKSLSIKGARFLAILWVLTFAADAQAEKTVARQWNEVLLDAIRIDLPDPPVHARNLFHTSAAMYDAWTVFDNESTGYFYTDKHSAGDINAARDEAISYAAYRVLSQRYTHAQDPNSSQALFDSLMSSLGYDKNISTTEGNTPAAIGNRIAHEILTSQLNDGSNEANGYTDYTGYQDVNPELVVGFPAVTVTSEAVNPNRWQRLVIFALTTQNGIPIPVSVQPYVGGPHWGNVSTFALGRDGNGPNSWSDIDPGAPPQLNGIGDAEYRQSTVDVIRYSHSLDPNKGPGVEMVNISPNSTGNRLLGTHDDIGYALNPVTGQPYEDNIVRVADYGRVLAEFWADGPNSETPPGHWNVLANKVSDNPLLEKRIGGEGPVLDDLQWDVKQYFALNAAVHDAAVAAWGTKRHYDYSRPITMIRYQGSLGQSSDPNLPSYHSDGLPLEQGLIELITAETIAPGGKHRNAYINANIDDSGNTVAFITEAEMIGRIAIMAWNHEPKNPETEVSGTDWIMAENWVPYQSANFITPAFPSYVSGHSTFSRAAAEVLSLFTGSEYFPGGMGEATFSPEYLEFEHGPSEELTLQWATYYDAADEAGISRLWGGIHVPADDFMGRIMGSSIGISAFNLANEYFGAIPEPDSILIIAMAHFCLLIKRRPRPS